MAQAPSKTLGAAIYSKALEYLEVYNKLAAANAGNSTNTQAITDYQDELEGNVDIKNIKGYSDICNNTIQAETIQIAALNSKLAGAAETILAYFTEDLTRTGIIIDTKIIAIDEGEVTVSDYTPPQP